MLHKQDNDGLEWARKPRSMMAWRFVFACIADKDSRFEGIVIEHKKQGRIVDGQPVKRWDYITQQWVVL